MAIIQVTTHQTGIVIHTDYKEFFLEVQEATEHQLKCLAEDINTMIEQADNAQYSVPKDTRLHSAIVRKERALSDNADDLDGIDG